ncbi:MAG TPA: cobalt ECF transporter T component CbiQ [Anaerolineales bacterium]|nr:cobalt ECF transporter T component CbiQ [Anaerolineales bacterium]
MHVHFLDPYRSRSSPIHRLDPRVKLVIALAFILTTALTPVGAWPIYVLLLAVVVSVALLADLGVRYVWGRAILAFPFILAAFPIIFTAGGPYLTEIQVWQWTLQISIPGLERFMSIAFKSWISVQAAILLASTTPFPDLLVAMRAIRIPGILVSIFGLMWRYLFVLADEALRLNRARAARSGNSGNPEIKTGGKLSWRARVAGGMAGSLFLRAYDRSDRIYAAMLSRGYDGEIRSLPLPVLEGSQILILAASMIALAVLLVLSYSL